MVGKQLELQTNDRKKTPHPDAGKMLRLLLKSREWVHAITFKDLYNWHDRHTRKLCQQSRGKIISGDKGYRATRCATIEEIKRAASRKYAAGRALIEGGDDIKREGHRALKHQATA